MLLERRWWGKTEVLGDNPLSAPLCQLKPLHTPPRDRSRVPTMDSWETFRPCTVSKSQMATIRKTVTQNTRTCRHLISITVCLETAFRYTSSVLINRKKILVMTRPLSRHTSDSPPGEEMKYDDMASLTLTHIYIYIYIYICIYKTRSLNKHITGYGLTRATTHVSHSYHS